MKHWPAQTSHKPSPPSEEPRWSGLDVLSIVAVPLLVISVALGVILAMVLGR